MNRTPGRVPQIELNLLPTAVLLTVLLLSCYSEASAQVIKREPSPEATTAGVRIHQLLSRIYALETFSVTQGADGNYRFCWQFFRSQPGAYRRVAKSLEAFQGNVHWHLTAASQDTYCIVASSKPLRHNEPLSDNSSILQSSKIDDYQADPFFALAEIPELCKYLEGSLALANSKPQAFDPDFVKKEKPESEEPVDFYEPGTHEVWLTNDPAHVTSHAGTSRRLNFGLTYPEWHAIFFDTLHVTKAKTADWLVNNSQFSNKNVPVYRFDDDVPGFPMLSRLRGPNETSSFANDEIHLLQKECMRLRNKSDNRAGLRGLNKLIRMCRWAIQLRTGIFMFPDEEADFRP